MQARTFITLCNTALGASCWFTAHITPFEEDDHLELRMASEYAELNLSNPPGFTQVSKADEALALLAAGENFDMVITLFNFGGSSSSQFPDKPLVHRGIVREARPGNDGLTEVISS